MEWNHDISQAPKSKIVTRISTVMIKGKEAQRSEDFLAAEYIIAATKCGLVVKTHWIPATGKVKGHWSGLAFLGDEIEQPTAWMPWPTHPSAVFEPVAVDSGMILEDAGF